MYHNKKSNTVMKIKSNLLRVMYIQYRFKMKRTLQSQKHQLCSIKICPSGHATLRKRHVASTYMRRCISVMCLLGCCSLLHRILSGFENVFSLCAFMFIVCCVMFCLELIQEIRMRLRGSKYINEVTKKRQSHDAQNSLPGPPKKKR